MFYHNPLDRTVELVDELLRNPKIKGEKGEKGEKGDRGEQGIQGATGLQGPRGEKGDKGDQGLRGIQGIQGEKGDRGLQGLPGKSAYEAWIDAGFKGSLCDFIEYLKADIQTAKLDGNVLVLTNNACDEIKVDLSSLKLKDERLESVSFNEATKKLVFTVGNTVDDVKKTIEVFIPIGKPKATVRIEDAFGVLIGYMLAEDERTD